MTRLEIVYNIKELLKEHTDDSLVSNDHILFLFGTYRAKYLRQLYSDRAKAIDNSALQTLCLSTSPVDRGTCGVTVDCEIVRTKNQIPDLLSIKGRPALTFVGPPIIGASGFDRISNGQVNSCMTDSYSTTSFFIDNGYIYIVGTEPAVKQIKCIRVKGIFENPTDLEGFSSSTCDSISIDPCVSDETDYPIPAHMVADINVAVLKNFIVTEKLEQTRDKDNNDVPE